MTPQPKRKVRKPRYTVISTKGQAFFYTDKDLVDVDIHHGDAKDCRRLAAWLIKAAGFLEQQEQGGMMTKVILFSVFLSGCTDTYMSSLGAYGASGHITCYSGGNIIFDGDSTGKIQTVEKSDGWEFKDKATGKFIRVSGACVIKN